MFRKSLTSTSGSGRLFFPPGRSPPYSLTTPVSWCNDDDVPLTKTVITQTTVKLQDDKTEHSRHSKTPKLAKTTWLLLQTHWTSEPFKICWVSIADTHIHVWVWEINQLQWRYWGWWLWRFKSVGNEITIIMCWWGKWFCQYENRAETVFEDHFNQFKTETPPFLGRALTLRFEYRVINIIWYLLCCGNEGNDNGDSGGVI